ncbi:MAG: dicarboxylate/amino acid:cation symporter [Planctomycetales bacterium]|nr:dicarboxylate/amino acid:cation symporter [Planctomycetales bacterium]
MKRIALHWQIMIGMIVGALIGLTVNFTAGTRATKLTGDRLPADVQSVEILDTPNVVRVTIETPEGTTVRTVDPTRSLPDSVASLEALETSDPRAYKLFQRYGQSWARRLGAAAQYFGGLFLRLLQMVAVPLIVTSLMTGVLGIGQADRLGRMFVRTITYYLVTSLLAIATGIMMVNLIQPGIGGQMNEMAQAAPHVEGNIVDVLKDQLLNLIPSNPLAALAQANFLSIISFTLAFTIFTVIVGGRTAEVIREFFESAFDVMMAMTTAIIRLAPLGVLFLMMYVTATQGTAVFVSLFWYMLAVVLALGVHACIVLPLIVKFVAKRSPLEFARAMSPALLTAFSSASSNGTLPLTLTSVEQRAGVSNRVSSFVLPLGATINMDGTALYEAVAVLFIGQLYRGEMLPLSQQIVVALTALLASVGAAGIPHAGLVMMVIILQAVGLPVEMQGIILAVDRVLDMCRTSVNVWSDSCGCAVVARFEAGGSSGPVTSDVDESMEFTP